MRFIATLAAALVLLGVGSATAQTPAAPPPGPNDDVVIDVNAGNIKPVPIAIASFSGATRGSDIAQVITANLQRSGLFDPIDPGAFPENGLDTEVLPRFAAWKAVNAQYLVNGTVTTAPDGRLQVRFRLYDTSGEQGLLGMSFTASPENWRRMAHKISDAIYEKLTGEKGYFDTRIVFVAESGGRLNRVKRLAIMDQDGANPSYLTDGSYIVMSPRFSSNSQEITYMALRPTGSSVYLFNIETGRQETIGRFPGMVFAPRFSPDGARVAFSAEKAGNSDVWVMDLRSRSQARLTTDPGIDTSPSFSPNGSQIVFNSDRGGSPQLYVMNGDGGNVKRISFGAGRYTTPVWSPDGQFIAFTKQQGSLFHIGVMRPDGSDERILTTSYLDEGPTWAPNGRVIMFSRATSGGAPRLWTVDVTGRIVQPAPYQSSGSDPAWSPLLD